MSLTVTIEHADEARELIKAIGPLTDRERSAVAAELARLVQRHLRARDNSNAHNYPDGGRRSHFWRKAAESVVFGYTVESSYVSVTHQGVRLRYAGAPEGIRPVNAKALAIPASGAAYGRLPREFSDLRIVIFKGKNKAALVQGVAGKKYDKNSNWLMPGERLGQIMFWLVPKTKPVAGDPTVLPSDNVVFGMAVMRIKQMRLRKMR